MGMMTRRNVKAREVKASLPLKASEVKEIKEEVKEEVTEEISTKMPFFQLKALAKKKGIDVEGKSAQELRKALSEVM